MTASKLTPAQRRILQAASRNEISTIAPGTGYDFGTWRISGRTGRAVTVPAESLIRKGLARKANEPTDGRLLLVVTAAGYEQLSAIRG